jgi:hypothetical protein
MDDMMRLVAELRAAVNARKRSVERFHLRRRHPGAPLDSRGITHPV